MASWQYLFLFPTARHRLKPEDAVEVLARFGFDFEHTVQLCVSIDKHGHLLDVGEEVSLRDPFMENLKELLSKNQSCSIQARNKELFLSCVFNTSAPSPHICLGWSRRLLERMSIERAASFWKLLRNVSQECQGSLAFIVNDAPDDFEDHVIQVDGQVMVDVGEHSRRLGITEVWINNKHLSSPPDGLKYGPNPEGHGILTMYSVSAT